MSVQKDKFASLGTNGKDAPFDDLVRLAMQLCEAPWGSIVLSDRERPWSDAELFIGLDAVAARAHVSALPDGGASETVPDDVATDRETQARFNASVPLSRASGTEIGQLSVWDDVERTLTDEQRAALAVVGRAVAERLDLQREKRLLERSRDLVEAQNDELQRALETQEQLDHEVHHRVGNALQMVASMLRMQARATDEDAVTAALEQAQTRVAAIGTIHVELGRAATTGRVDLASYLRAFCDSIGRSHARPVRFDFDTELVLMTAQRATAVAMIVNEFVSNSARYAFSSSNGGTIGVHLRMAEDSSGAHVAFTLRDDGQGYDSSFWTRGGPALGQRIIDAAARQLDGLVALDRMDDGDMRLRLVFDLNEDDLGDAVDEPRLRPAHPEGPSANGSAPQDGMMPDDAVGVDRPSVTHQKA